MRPLKTSLGCLRSLTLRFALLTAKRAGLGSETILWGAGSDSRQTLPIPSLPSGTGPPGGRAMSGNNSRRPRGDIPGTPPTAEIGVSCRYPLRAGLGNLRACCFLQYFKTFTKRR